MIGNKPSIYNESSVFNAPTVYNAQSVYNVGGGGGEITEVEIGGKIYPVVKIGNLYWISQNLDLKLDIPIGVSGRPYTAAAWYYNNSESTYGWNGRKFGLLYNGACIDIINSYLSTNNNGWHVATNSEWIQLYNDAGGNNIPLKSTSFGGTNELGFNIEGHGYRSGATGSFSGLGNEADFRTDVNNGVETHNDSSHYQGIGGWVTPAGGAIRLVMNA